METLKLLATNQNGFLSELQLEKSTCFYTNKECIPTGCVPSAAVAVLGGRGVCPMGWGYLSHGGHGLCPMRVGVSAPWGGGLPRFCQTPTSVNRMADACENITFPQLLLRTVLYLNVYFMLFKRICYLYCAVEVVSQLKKRKTKSNIFEMDLTALVQFPKLRTLYSMSSSILDALCHLLRIEKII